MFTEVRDGDEQQGFHVALHVHDEVVVVVPEDKAGQAKAAVQEALTTTPTWAPGLPLEAEVNVGTHYEK